MCYFSPESAVTTNFSVRNGDLILLASDGLFDNMPDSMIEAELSKLKVCTILAEFFLFVCCLFD